ncbi:hypothetical protein HMPREF0658_1019 [Hoylesella marshii DSM 16973 = JCM 13450]|uniref:Uncharacterized protein n=1 Tax=Hoylesella marshii DSM 16973 = JCM 13450 TaxID=862515 RepID=E0NS68_9BACT|nr:hypothetical protein HMPREF0658_1019 [Hoylesella marshii DSM 16973 = JCM 13450]
MNHFIFFVAQKYEEIRCTLPLGRCIFCKKQLNHMEYNSAHGVFQTEIITFAQHFCKLSIINQLFKVV